MFERAKYTLDGSIIAMISDKVMIIPDNIENRHRILLADWEAAGNAIEPYLPEPEAPSVISIPAVTLWERMTEAEGEQVEAVMQTQPFRIRQIFTTAQTYRSDHELWPLLQHVATELFGAQRAGELLAQS
ncbi:hypothetical protein KQ944_07810 [Bacillus subtilis]|uniref:hypothetical protein n=1 Tax=Pseudochrobactrum asaccharolyticum TaxID=354351 RepID=UPI001F398AFD|nr:hypothetical protein [Pseudochrobactrum asaccharolyticum]MCF7645045.1 hypothetical protein [Pseudochrobactrum asaccharolyticum]MCF7671528.1 hypothetical protein [Bacillus subtilis]